MKSKHPTGALTGQHPRARTFIPQDFMFQLAGKSPQGIAALAAQGGAAPLTEGRDKTFSVGQFSSADRE